MVVNKNSDGCFCSSEYLLTTKSTGRKIYLEKVGGTYLVPDGTTTDYIDWPLSDGATKTLTDILDRDYSLSMLVEWESSSPEDGLEDAGCVTIDGAVHTSPAIIFAASIA